MDNKKIITEINQLETRMGTFATVHWMKARRMLTDIAIVLIIPLVVLAGLYFWTPGSDRALLSLVAPTQKPEFGVKARTALETLKSISMDVSFFEDPVYQSLQEFSTDVPPAILGRTYPLTPPPALRNMNIKVEKPR